MIPSADALSDPRAFDGGGGRALNNLSSTVYINTLSEKIYPITIILLFAWALLANIILIRVLLKYELITPQNTLIRVTLAVVDILMACFGMHLILPLVFPETSLSIEHCSIITDLGYATGFFSFMVMAIMSFERYIFFVRPLKYTSYIKSRCVIVLADPECLIL